MPCPRCGAAHVAAQKFCAECGAALGGAPGPRGAGAPASYTPKHLAEKILTSKAALEGERKSYRESTISLNYYGDSIVNSVGDVIAFVLGYAGAGRLPVWVSALAFVTVEAALLLTIRDSLLLNIVMLLHPVPLIKAWQMGG
jgi:hypothetical protein